MYKLGYSDFVDMRNALRYFREIKEAKGWSRVQKLRSIPFGDSGCLFSTYGIPCPMFGKQLVYKIVDELIDCGLQNRPKED